MAITFSSLLHPSTVANADIQRFGQFVEDTLVNGGWIVTTDTGQTLPSTMTGTTAGLQRKGYRIYRMNDALQSTKPVFMKLEFGCGNFAQCPCMWVTIGTGSDGAGNITGVYFPGGSATNPTMGNGALNFASSSQATNSYGGAAPNRVSIALCVCNNANYPTVFCLERSKDLSGNDTGEGLLMVYTEGGSALAGVSATRYIHFDPYRQPSTEIGISYILSVQNPQQSFGGNIGVGLPFYFRGLALQTGTNLLIVNSADIPTESTFTMSIFGSNVTYQHLNVFPAIRGSYASTPQQPDTLTRICTRYD